MYRATGQLHTDRLSSIDWLAKSILAASLVLAMSGPAFGIIWRHDRTDPDSDIRHPRSRRHETSAKDNKNVGLIRTDSGYCSGTVINNGERRRSNWVLTAGHCVAGGPEGGPASNVVFDINGTTYQARKWIAQMWYEGSEFTPGTKTHDIALIKTKRTIKKVKPARISTKVNEMDKTVEFVGFGETGDGLTGSINEVDGVKRSGFNKIDALGMYWNSSKGYTVLLTDFDAPTDLPFIPLPILPVRDNPASEDIPLDYEADTAKGDSGGGMFINGKLVGVTSFGTINSGYFSTAGYTRVGAYLNWIKRVQTLDTAGSPPPSFGSPGASVDGGHIHQKELPQIPVVVGFPPQITVDLDNLEARTLFRKSSDTGVPSLVVDNDGLVRTFDGELYTGISDYLVNIGDRRISHSLGSPTPEPSTTALLLGLGGIMILNRRRHR